MSFHPRIFLLGASGYVGGQILKQLSSTHPEYHVVALARTDKQAQALKRAYPDLETVLGDLESAVALSQQSRLADVVVQAANSDHVEVIKSLINGLHSGGKKGTYLHISGFGILSDISNGYGEVSQKVYHDIDDIDELLSLDYSHVHRLEDETVIETGRHLGVPTAILVPSLVYGVGEGPIKKRSGPIPMLVQASMKSGRVFRAGKGENRWSTINVKDLAAAAILLVTEALKPGGGDVTWGPEGYYLCESGEEQWKDIAKAVAEHGFRQGIFIDDQVREVPEPDLLAVHMYGRIIWASNARGRAQRLKRLGWTPSGESIYDTLPATIAFEAEYAKIET